MGSARRVIATRDGKGFHKGDTGTLLKVDSVHGELCYVVQLDDGREVGPLPQSCWTPSPAVPQWPSR